jgi:hypothetical protein
VRGGRPVNGSNLVMGDCNTSNVNAVTWFGNNDSSVRSALTPEGKCVGLAERGSTVNGTQLVIWDCHLHADQQWQMAATPSHYGLRWRDW